ncbi:putative leucine-rich repeat-containing protein DDB_G0290503 isoform X2 [Mytilus californianus]|nr:putative leucine-rich repeat-containing protein DDB_G0290503 isoform X2 [Mytilus californianus]
MAEDKTFKGIIIEALNFHNRKIRDYIEQIADWKERFGVLQRQKQRYQEEYRNIKREVETHTQENNKLKGEIDSLRQIINRDQRNDRCTACSSFQHTIQTLKDVYENTLTQKDNHITYLENRIKELERRKHNDTNGNLNGNLNIGLSSPDSTSKYTPHKTKTQPGSNDGHAAAESNGKSHDKTEEDPSPDRIDKSLKLRLPRNKKRSRYSEDPSPEQKRQRMEETMIEMHSDGIDNDRITGKSSRKDNLEKRPHIIVPETCLFDADLDEEEEEAICDEKADNHIGSDDAKNHSETKKNKWTIAMDTSSSSENEDNGLILQDQGQKEKQVNRSWLHSMLSSPDLDQTKLNIGGQSDELEGRKISLMKNKSDPSHMLKQLNPGREKGKTLSQHDSPLKVVPLKDRKIRKKTMKSNCTNVSDDIGGETVHIHSSPEFSSPSLVSHGQTVRASQQPIDIPSDHESPLILRSSGLTSENEERYPEVDVLFEDSESSQSGKILNLSKDRSVEKLSRKVRGQKSRLPEKSPDINSSLKMRERKSKVQEKSPLKDMSNMDDEFKNKLRQSTLSQAFMNSTKQDTDLQQAIEQSLQDSTGKLCEKGQSNDELIESKENSPPFKKPAVPKPKFKRSKVRKSADLDETIAPAHYAKHLPDIDMEETMAPSRINDKPKGGNSDPFTINGSLDPAIELSQLCAESQDLGDELEMTLQNRHNNGKRENRVKESSDFIDTLQDFRLEDLHGNGDAPKTSTCVDFGDDSQAIPCSSTSVKFGGGRLKGQKKKLKTGDMEDLEKEEPQINKQMEDSFDVRPKITAEPGYAYVDVVRGKDDRRKLKAFWCQECADFYKDTGESDEAIQKRMQECSRHRAKHAPPSTPEHFWSVGFMDTPECEERGYINREESPEEKKEPKFNRRSKYRKLFKSKNEEEKYS